MDLEELMRRPEGVVTDRFGCPMREKLHEDGAWSASSNIDNEPCKLYYLDQMPEPVQKPAVIGPILVVHLINYGSPERPSNPEGR